MKDNVQGTVSANVQAHDKKYPPEPEPYFDDEIGSEELQNTLVAMEKIALDFLDENWDHPLAKSFQPVLEAAASLLSSLGEPRDGERQTTHSDESFLTRQATWDAERKEWEYDYIVWCANVLRPLLRNAQELQQWLSEWIWFEVVHSGRRSVGRSSYHSARSTAARMYYDYLQAKRSWLELGDRKISDFLEHGFHTHGEFFREQMLAQVRKSHLPSKFPSLLRVLDSDRPLILLPRMPSGVQCD